MMTDKRRLEIIRNRSEGMRALSEEGLARRQQAGVESMRQRGPLTSLEIASAQNLWPAMPIEAAMPDAESLWVRLKRLVVNII